MLIEDVMLGLLQEVLTSVSTNLAKLFYNKPGSMGMANELQIHHDITDSQFSK